MRRYRIKEAEVQEVLLENAVGKRTNGCEVSPNRAVAQSSVMSIRAQIGNRAARAILQSPATRQSSLISHRTAGHETVHLSRRQRAVPDGHILDDSREISPAAGFSTYPSAASVARVIQIHHATGLQAAINIKVGIGPIRYSGHMVPGVDEGGVRHQIGIVATVAAHIQTEMSVLQNQRPVGTTTHSTDNAAPSARQGRRHHPGLQ